MRILIIGGTEFLGRHLVECALARGHHVTIFNRGRHNNEIHAGVERLRGDRRFDLNILGSRRWECVIDTCGYTPSDVRATAKALKGAVGHYTFISTLSVYEDYSVKGVDEDGALKTISEQSLREAEETELKDPIIAANYGAAYGPLKALCEQAIEEEMPGRVLNVRSGLIAGPYDYTDRFTYWPRRLAQGGEVLAPGRPQRQVQFIDARDLSAWIISMAEQRKAGAFNASGPDYTLSMRDVLEQCGCVAGTEPQFVWVSDEFLLEAGVAPWSELPLWIPENIPELAGFLSVNCAKAIAAGLTFRPLADTVRETVAWINAMPERSEPRAGIGREREAELLRDWRQRGG